MLSTEKSTVRLHVRISSRQKSALEAIARRHDAILTAVIKAAIEQLLAQEGCTEDQV
jgi:predicted transcriptional regulator